MSEDKIFAISRFRHRAQASAQKTLGLKVGGTMTVWSVSDGVNVKTIETWGASPSDRLKAAKRGFIEGSFSDYKLGLRAKVLT